MITQVTWENQDIKAGVKAARQTAPAHTHLIVNAGNRGDGRGHRYCIIDLVNHHALSFSPERNVGLILDMTPEQACEFLNSRKMIPIP